MPNRKAPNTPDELKGPKIVASVRVFTRSRKDATKEDRKHWGGYRNDVPKEYGVARVEYTDGSGEDFLPGNVRFFTP